MKHDAVKKNIKILFLISSFIEFLFQTLNAICITFITFSIFDSSSKNSVSVAKQRQFLDTGYQVGQHTVDLTLRERGGVTGHVLRQLQLTHRSLVLHAGVVLTLHSFDGVVGVQTYIQFQCHNSFLFLNC